MKTLDSYNYVQIYNKDGSMVIKDFSYSIKQGFEKSKTKVLCERTQQQIDHSIETSVSRTRQEIYKLIQNNDFDYMVTLTVSPDVCDRYNDDEVYKQFKSKIYNFINRKDKAFKYILIPERHKDGALHFHMLCSRSPTFHLLDVKEKDRSGRKMYTAGLFERLGRCRITEIDNQDSAKKYITKYVTKSSLEVGTSKKRYWASRNLEKPIERKFMLSPDDKKSVLEQVVKTNTVQFSKTVSIPQLNNTLNIYNTIPL